MREQQFSVKKRKVVFSKGPIHLVDCEVRMADGRILSRQIIEHPGAVVIMPQSRGGHFFLIKQFRFAVRKWLWEFPAGGIEPGESLKTAAARELAEEIGYKSPESFTKYFKAATGISPSVYIKKINKIQEN